MKPVRNKDGVIINTAVLLYRDVRRKKVLCPGCGEFTFKKWPGGWDGHAQVCAGLEETDIELRKVEFKTAFRYLFG
jgi:hypothetical protein